MIEVEEGQSLLVALKKSGFFIKSSCGGMATCGDCVVKICGGSENLGPPQFSELKLMGNVFHLTKERLSCQSKVFGEGVEIDITHHDQSTAGSFSTPKAFNRPPKVHLRKGGAVNSNSGDTKSPEKSFEKSTRRSLEEDQDRDQKKQFKGGGRRPKPFKYSNS